MRNVVLAFVALAATSAPARALAEPSSPSTEVVAEGDAPLPNSVVDGAPAVAAESSAATAVGQTQLTSAAAPASSGGGGSSSLQPPALTWPIYVLGGVGLAGLGVAAIYGGLSANASHAIDVSKQTLQRYGRTPSTCDAAPVVAPYGPICASLSENTRLAPKYDSIFTPSLIVGISATALAAGWFFFAPKDQKANDRVGVAHVAPWVSAGSGGALVQGRF